MSVIKLSERIIERMNETTTSDAIDFLPTHLGAVQGSLRKLAKKKNKWQLSVLDHQDKYKVRFENMLEINVRKEHWQEFMNSVLGKDSVVFTDIFEIDLSSHLKEGKDKDMAKLFNELETALLKLTITPPVGDMDGDFDLWEKTFGGGSYSTPKTVLLPLNDYLVAIRKLMKELKIVYKDDRGSVEMLIASLGDKRALNSFSIFENYDYLSGITIISNYHGIGVTFEALVDMAFVPSYQISVDDMDAAYELDGEKDIKVVQNRIYPRGKRFPSKVFKQIKDAIDSVGDKEKKDDRVAKESK
jgi:hypothetical protein